MSRVVCNYCDTISDLNDLVSTPSDLAGKWFLSCPNCKRHPARFSDAPDLVCDCIDGEFTNGRRV